MRATSFVTGPFSLVRSTSSSDFPRNHRTVHKASALAEAFFAPASFSFIFLLNFAKTLAKIMLVWYI